jgi:serine/threonine protein kinase
MNVNELPDLIGGRYRPIRKLGEGSMGFVFEVEHAGTGDRLALKVMRTHSGPLPAVVERFKREARTAARIKSEHVVRVIDADVIPELEDGLYLVMELLEGTDLDRACEEPQTPEVVVEWLRQVAHGLDKAHALGIVHRDLKPENLFLTSGEHGEPRVKILDFGVAKTLEDAPGTTQTGQLLGTPLFMSPEHARAAGEIGPPADRFALGLVAFRLLAGTDYWLPSPNVAGIISQILYEPMAPPSERGLAFGPRFDAWFARACNRDPAQRYQTSMDLVKELSAALGTVWGAPIDRTSISLSPRVRWEDPAIHSRPETTMAPTLSSASSPGPTSKRKHRGRLIIGALAALSGLLLWGVLAVTQARRVSKNGSDEPTAPAHAAAQSVPLRPPLPEKAAPPPAVTLEAPAAPVEAPQAATRASDKEAPPAKEARAESAGHALSSRAMPAASGKALGAPPPRPSKKKARAAADDDPLADQK